MLSIVGGEGQFRLRGFDIDRHRLHVDELAVRRPGRRQFAAQSLQHPYLANVIDHRMWNRCRCKILGQFGCRMVYRYCTDVLVTILPFCLAALVCLPGFIADRAEFFDFGKPLPLQIIADRNIDKTIPGRVGIGRDELAVLVAATGDFGIVAIKIHQGQCRNQPGSCRL